jgi:predicted regulator of Ras-like GTPase activity (Roadblock/LC7/MglB family)
MVLLSERSREIADLTTELGRAKAEALRHLEDAQSSTRQLRRTNEKLVEIAQAKQSLESEQHRYVDEIASVRLELAAQKARSIEFEHDLKIAQTDVARLHQELDATKRTLEAQLSAWDQERSQLTMTVSGLTLEIQSEHQAARLLERRWLRSSEADADLAKLRQGPSANERSTDATGEVAVLNLRVAHAEAALRELDQLREERATLSSKVRELEREAGASRELTRLQQELRSVLVDKNLLERRLEDAEFRNHEREELRTQIAELQQFRIDAELARAEVERLRARLYKAPLTSGTYAARTESYLDELGSSGDDVEIQLQRLGLQAEAQHVVIADHRGFPVASLGDSATSEIVAAVAGIAERFSHQARQLLELAEVTQFTVQDRNGTVAHYRFFAIDEDVMSVAVIGRCVPDEPSLDRVVSAMIQRLTDPRERAARIRKAGGQ